MGRPAGGLARLGAASFAVILIAGCDGLSGGPGRGSPHLSPTATLPASATPSVRPSPAQSPASPSVAGYPPLADELVWFSPNMGSTDHVELFTDPTAWAGERDLIDVFLFHSQVLFPEPCPICGANALGPLAEAGAFGQLAAWGIAIAVGVGAVYEDGCDGAANYERDAGAVIRNVEASGGTVRLIVMDEPLLHSGPKDDPLACDYGPAEAAVETAAFVRALHAERPEIIVGLVEPYPHHTVAQLQDWIVELERNGVVLPFLQLDVDVERVRVEGQDVAADLASLEGFAEGRGIDFGVIFTSNWTRAGSNQAYYESTMEWLATVREAIGRPTDVVFQSWHGPAPSSQHEVPVNLPRNDPGGFGHLALLRDGLRALGASDP